MSEVQLEGYEAQLEAIEGHLEGSKGQPRGDGLMDGRKISPFYRTSSPYQGYRLRSLWLFIIPI